MKRVLCIAGSPRRGGNSAGLLDAFAAGVTEAGGTPERLAVADLEIQACKGCGACSATGECLIRDDMDDVYPLLDSAQALVIATPVYFATVPAVLKALYDRCQPYWARRYLLGAERRPKKRPGALLVVGGGGDPFGTSCVVTPTKSVMGVLDVSLDTVLEVVGPDDRGEIARFTSELEKARSAGASLAGRIGA